MEQGDRPAAVDHHHLVGLGHVRLHRQATDGCGHRLRAGAVQVGHHHAARPGGSKGLAQRLADALASQALQALEETGLNDTSLQPLRALAAMVVQRQH